MTDTVYSTINLFVPNKPFFYPLKTLENPKVFCSSGKRERVHWEQLG